MVRNSLDPDWDFWLDPDSMNMDPKHCLLRKSRVAQRHNFFVNNQCFGSIFILNGSGYGSRPICESGSGSRMSINAVPWYPKHCANLICNWKPGSATKWSGSVSWLSTAGVLLAVPALLQQVHPAHHRLLTSSPSPNLSLRYCQAHSLKSLKFWITCVKTPVKSCSQEDRIGT